MNFVQPQALAWAVCALLIIALLWWRRRAPAQPVTTLVFFQRLQRHYAESPWRRLLKRLIATLLLCAMVVGLALRLAGLQAAASAEQVDQIVVVVDRSASTGAQQEENHDDVLAGLLQDLRRAVAALPATTRCTVLAVDARVAVVQPATRDRALLDRCLAELQPRPLPGVPERGLRLARQLAAIDGPAAIWWVGDAAPPSAVDRQFVAALSEPVNAGITAAALRRLPQAPEHAELFIEVQATRATPADLEVLYDDELQGLRQLQLDRGRPERLLVPITVADAASVRLRLRAPGDVLAADDELLVPLPPPRTRRIGLLGEVDSFTALALATLGAEVAAETATAEDLDGYDLLIAAGSLPDPWPACPLILLDPPAGDEHLRLQRLDPARVVVPRAIDRAHPCLVGVNGGDELSVAQTGRLLGPASVQPLWSGAAGPLFAAGRIADQRVVVACFDPRRSPRLALSPRYASLIASSVYWCLADDEGLASIRASGRLLRGRAGALQWTTIDGAEATVAVPATGLLLDRLGLWRLGDEVGATALLSAAETALPSEPATPATTAVVSAAATPALPRWLLLFVGLLALGEWLLWQRWRVV